MMTIRRRQTAAEMPVHSRIDIREIEKSYARLFATPDGKKVLAHLNATTFMRTAGAEASDQTLRYLEGQRALLSSILRMIERGHNP